MSLKDSHYIHSVLPLQSSFFRVTRFRTKTPLARYQKVCIFILSFMPATVKVSFANSELGNSVSVIFDSGALCYHQKSVENPHATFQFSMGLDTRQYT